MSLNVKKDDKVVVLSGKDKGKEGRVVKVMPKKGSVIVEGVNVVKRHTKPNQQNQSGGILEKEAPIPASNVMVISPKSGKPVRVVRQREAGKPSVRVSAKDKVAID